MARDLILEIGVEEIPSAYMEKALADLASIAGKCWRDARLAYREVKSFGTPRRLVLFVEGLQERQEDAHIENRGPKRTAAFDSEGKPSRAGLGFARSQGLDFANLEIREVGGVEYLFAVKSEPGKAAAEIIPALLADIIHALSFPKSMRWGYYPTRFARPIRWILALFGNEVLPLTIDNIASDRISYGHRFLSSGPIEVPDTEAYFHLLEKNYVMVNQVERRECIRQQVAEVANRAGGTPINDEDLLEEVTHLVEYPTAFFGNFSPSYLEVPPEVLTTTMIEHQRYFPVYGPDGELLPGFIGVRNGTEQALDLVVAGNERVIKARLEDALFFWKEDTRKPLEDLVPGLRDVLFHERLGSLQDKVERLQKLAVLLGQETGLSKPEHLERAAWLCKADLLSNMVYEFPELQGIMGRYYAIHSGEEKEVSEAILEHYLPRFSGDRLPQSGTGILLSLAEKIDNLVSCFAIGIKPTGSQDPYALRRQAIGLVNIVLEQQLPLDLETVLKAAYDNLEVKTDLSREETTGEVLDFILQRMRGVLSERSYAYDVLDAVFALSSFDLGDLYKRVAVVQDFKQSPHYNDFMVVFNRANNLSRKWDDESVDAEVLVDDSEKELWRAYNLVRFDIHRAIRNGDYLQALETLAGLRPRVDDFFLAVMVMVDDEALRAARLGLLKAIANLCHMVADFGRIVE